MRELIGEDALAKLDQFSDERNDRTRTLVQNLAGLLMHSATPLEPAQIDALREVFAAHREELAPGSWSPSAQFSARVEAVLSPAQLTAWRYFQRSQWILAEVAKVNQQLIAETAR